MWHEIALIYSCHAQAGTRVASQCEAGVGVPVSSCLKMQKTAVRRSVSALEHATVLTLSLSLYLSLLLFPCRSAFAYGVLQLCPVLIGCGC